MDWKDIFEFLKHIITISAIVLIVAMLLKSGFMLNTIKIDYQGFNIEVSGYEKNTQPDQK